MNEKFRCLGIMLYYLLNNDDFSLSSKLFLNDIHYFFDAMLKNVQISNSELEVLEIIK